ncbi:MAG: RNA polymerase sigma factor [Bacillota bacterium]
MDERELVQRCQRGEESAFEALFRQHAPRVLQTAYLVLGDRQAAEDVMQEAFAQTFRVIGQLREPEAFRSWLYKLTVRRAWQQATRERTHQEVVRRLGALPPGQERFPVDEVERRNLIADAILTLPAQQRAAVVLFYFHDRPLGEIAALLDAPEGTVKSWLHRAKATLARLLGEPHPSAGGGA